MGAPTVEGFQLVRIVGTGKVRLLSWLDFSNQGDATCHTEFECEPTVEAIAAAVQAKRESLEAGLRKEHADYVAFHKVCAWDSPTSPKHDIFAQVVGDTTSGIRQESFEWRRAIDELKLPATAEEIAALPPRTIGGYVDIRLNDGGNVAQPSDLQERRWQVFEVVPDTESAASLHEVVVRDGLGFAEAWQLAVHHAHSGMLDPLEHPFRPSFCFDL